MPSYALTTYLVCIQVIYMIYEACPSIHAKAKKTLTAELVLPTFRNLTLAHLPTLADNGTDNRLVGGLTGWET